MHEEWTDKLSEYLDDELPAGERAALERHLAGCASCTAVLNDLNTVVARAGSLASRAPDVDLWPAIAGALRRRDRAPWDARLREWWTSRVTVSLPQAAAASVAIALLSAAAVWSIALRWSNRSSTPVPVTEATTTQPPDAEGSAGADRRAAGPAIATPAA